MRNLRVPKPFLSILLPILAVIFVICLNRTPRNSDELPGSNTRLSSGTSRPAPAKDLVSNSPAMKMNPHSAGKFALSDPAVQRSLNENMGKINFIPNKKQFGKEALYVFNTPQAQMIVFKDRLRMIAIHKIKKAKDKFQDDESEKQVVDIKFPGSANLQPEAIALAGTPSFNYFNSEANVTGIQSASELRFKDIYPGVKLRLYSNAAGSLEFDWLVNNPVDYKAIRMQFEGQDKLSMDEAGNLELGLRFGSLKINIPESYQVAIDGSRKKVSAGFDLTGQDIAGYTVKEKLNESQPLVIDPKLMWGSFMEGNNANFDAYLFSGIHDANGDLYIAGGANKITNIDLQTVAYGSPVAGFASIPPSGAATTGNNGKDWLIMKIKKDGTAVLIYTFFGLSSASTSTREQAHCIDISPNGGTIFVGGICDAQGTSLPLPALTPAYSANTAFGGTSSAGTFTSPNGIPTVAAFTVDLASLKYRSFIGNGTPLGDVSSIEAINDNDYILASTVTANLGNGAGAVNYASVGLDQTYSAGTEIYIGKFTSFNTRSWGTYVGGDGNDQVDDMRTLSNGDIVFCGFATSTNASMTTLSNEIAATTNRNNNTTASDGLVGVIAANGSAFNMLSKVGGSGDDEITGLEAGNCDTVYAVGETFSTNFPNIGVGVLQTTADANVASAAAGVGGNGTGTSNNGGDMILGKFSATGNTTGTTFSYYGGNGTDIANSIGYIPIGLGTLFIFGSTSSNSGMNPANNITGNTFYQSSFQGAWDMFFIECTPDFKTKNLATYCGGSGSDYLGNTGAQVTGKQMRILNDTAIGIFTTSHSGTFLPNIIGSSFDITRSNPTGGSTDAWILFSLNVSDVLGAVDFGDAPAPYGRASTLISVSGANTDLSLGSKVDDDRSYPGTPGVAADFDNNEGNSVGRKPGTAMYYDIGASGSATANDEDGIASVSVLPTNATTYSATVNYYNNSGSTATLYGFIDFNQDGDFNDANEKVVVSGLASNATAASGRTATLTWTVPGPLTAGTTYLRLILVKGTGSAVLTGCAGGLSYVKNQAYGIGEVEDYPVTISTVLPLTLLDFRGVLLSNNNTSLYWTTDHELNVQAFDVEHSVDGIHFSKIATVAPHGSTASTTDYTYLDNNPPAGNNYYRLKIIDNDGKFVYSKILAFHNNGPAGKTYSYPSPFTDNINIVLNADKRMAGLVQLYDSRGSLVAQKRVTLEKGSNNISLDRLRALAPGSYTISVKTPGSGTVNMKTIKNQ